MVTKEFITAGKATFTVIIPEQHRKTDAGHYTYRVKRSKDGRKTFVSLLTGPDNTSDYTYIGCMDEAGSVHTTAASRLPKSCFPVALVDRVLSRVIAGEVEPIVAAGFEVKHAGKCGRCGRTLTEPTSLECGIGPECRQIMGI